ncbi:hypothetical protein N7462_000932 [Penicillium macrosclerotiorum]|uniref:uncharacterized protein n=1 Tax=Penicillium macrosclerotiorum TaxID=303699 RepID=UPI00254859EF|nr:uncharacterized protein N7462_000932 [Penicillium macrosclerotiorum]KAJ5698927.1 hypothetical protein N7462_000932 [Penicillium macrosclerotiorum]
MANSARIQDATGAAEYLYRLCNNLGNSNLTGQSHLRTTLRHRADQLGIVPSRMAEIRMTHTTGLGVGSAAIRHRPVIGGGAERQERDPGRPSALDTSNDLR